MIFVILLTAERQRTPAKLVVRSIPTQYLSPMMNPTRLLLFLAIMLVAGTGLTDSSLATDLPFDPVGARHIGMGAASTAVWAGPDAIYHNPASLVWQTLTFSAGMQPIQFVDNPSSWWFHFYNKETEYGVPASLVAQGWDYSSPEGGTGHFFDLGLPVAFNFTDNTPGAATIHFAFEKRPDGDWKFNVPLDLGFLARHSSGATLGIVMRGLTFGSDGFESRHEHVEYGVSYGVGSMLTISSSAVWSKGDEWDSMKDRYRVGAELGGSYLIHLLGGYIQEPDRWYATGGIALRSDENARYEFIYSAVYDHEREHFRHFLQYGLRMN